MFRPLETFARNCFSCHKTEQGISGVDRLLVENERLLSSDKKSCRKRVLIRVFQKVIPGTKNRVMVEGPDMGKIRLYFSDVEKI
jgi:hypothetical protein